MLGWLKAMLGARPTPPEQIPPALWELTLLQFPFLAQRPPADLLRLRQLTELFLRQKEFHGAQGMRLTDQIAVAISAQACLPILNMGTGQQALRWYDDFVGIVVHPGEVLARRESVDDAGVVHHYSEVLSGEAMDGGPIMLNWQDVQSAGASAAQGYNVVIHEFTHKMDMRDGQADGCPPLWAGFMGSATARQARLAWKIALQTEYQHFREQVIIAERFGGSPTWLDPYGAESIDEFFAVASEAFHVNRPSFTQAFPALLPLFDAFFNGGLNR
jgi:Mlc titration factor MtfA (ptsG expression regulator)